MKYDLEERIFGGAGTVGQVKITYTAGFLPVDVKVRGGVNFR